MHIPPSSGDTPSFTEYAGRYMAEHLACLQALPLAAIEATVDHLWDAYERDATIFICGNGGSASMSSHFASDLARTVMSPDLIDHARRFRVVSLVDNVALLTAWSNDESYARIFAEPLYNLARSGDVLVAISGSGASLNIIAALEAARDLQLTTIGLTGQSGGRLRTDADICIAVETDKYEHNEPLHSMIFHLITFYLRERLIAYHMPEAASVPSLQTVRRAVVQV